MSEFSELPPEELLFSAKLDEYHDIFSSDDETGKTDLSVFSLSSFGSTTTDTGFLDKCRKGAFRPRRKVSRPKAKVDHIQSSYWIKLSEAKSSHLDRLLRRDTIFHPGFGNSQEHVIPISNRRKKEADEFTLLRRCSRYVGIWGTMKSGSQWDLFRYKSAPVRTRSAKAKLLRQTKPSVSGPRSSKTNTSTRPTGNFMSFVSDINTSINAPAVVSKHNTKMKLYRGLAVRADDFNSDLKKKQDKEINDSVEKSAIDLFDRLHTAVSKESRKRLAANTQIDELNREGPSQPKDKLDTKLRPTSVHTSNMSAEEPNQVPQVQVTEELGRILLRDFTNEANKLVKHTLTENNIACFPGSLPLNRTEKNLITFDWLINVVPAYKPVFRELNLNTLK